MSSLAKITLSGLHEGVAAKIGISRLCVGPMSTEMADCMHGVEASGVSHFVALQLLPSALGFSYTTYWELGRQDSLFLDCLMDS